MYQYWSEETDLLTIEADILRSKAMDAIFVVRETGFWCVLMYRPIGTPATPSGLYLTVFPKYLHLRVLAVVGSAALLLVLRKNFFRFGPFISGLNLIHSDTIITAVAWAEMCV